MHPCPLALALTPHCRGHGAYYARPRGGMRITQARPHPVASPALDLQWQATGSTLRSVHEGEMALPQARLLSVSNGRCALAPRTGTGRPEAGRHNAALPVHGLVMTVQQGGGGKARPRRGSNIAGDAASASGDVCTATASGHSGSSDGRRRLSPAPSSASSYSSLSPGTALKPIIPVPCGHWQTVSDCGNWRNARRLCRSKGSFGRAAAALGRQRRWGSGSYELTAG